MRESQSREQNKKRQQYLILGALALLGIVLLMVGNTAEDVPENKACPDSGQAAFVQTESTNTVNDMERKLAHTLSQIQGAGDITVQITLKGTGRKEYAVDTQRTTRSSTEESADTIQQTTEVQEQISIVQQNQSGTQQALLLEELAPEVAGVLVVASGADDAVVQERLLHAVSALLQLPLHQIMVMPGEEGK